VVVGNEALYADAELVEIANASDLVCFLFGLQQDWKQQRG
jgi:hypothetical protein